ncbi:MAG: ABC transporter substrate-binding protein [Methanothrix sp.]|nr:ABC transporter substrate-binding protein [Methanothrix sp.]
MRLLKKWLMVLTCVCLLMSTGWAAEETRTVVDSRGVEVQIPAQIERVVTVSAGLIESMMFILGEEEKIVGVGTSSVQNVFNYTFPTVGGETHEYQNGTRPVTYLYPRIRDLPLIGEGTAMNYEALAGLNPDLVLLRVGIWQLPSMDDEGVRKTISTIEALGIPVVVLKGPPCFDKPDISTISDEIRILGEVFGKEEKADKLAEYIESQTQVVFERTKDIPEAERPTVLIFGASSTARKAGMAGSVMGTDTIDSYFIEEIVHAKNAYQNAGSPTISAEQLLALDPDVIVLCTSNGYHPPEELYSAPYYQNVGELSAVKNRRVMSLPWTPSNTRRLEYPIDVMVIAKAAYPDRFADIDLGDWLLDFYKNVYGVDEDTAKALRSVQWMDWCVEK